MAYPIPIKTTNGETIHLYVKEHKPIFGTQMIKSQFIVIIVSKNKKFCGFISEKSHQMKKYIYHGIQWPDWWCDGKYLRTDPDGSLKDRTLVGVEVDDEEKINFYKL